MAHTSHISGVPDVFWNLYTHYSTRYDWIWIYMSIRKSKNLQKVKIEKYKKNHIILDEKYGCIVIYKLVTKYLIYIWL